MPRLLLRKYSKPPMRSFGLPLVPLTMVMPCLRTCSARGKKGIIKLLCMEERNMYRILRLIYSYRTTMFASIYLLSKRFFIKAKNSDECVGYLIFLFFIFWDLSDRCRSLSLSSSFGMPLSLSLSPPPAH